MGLISCSPVGPLTASQLEEPIYTVMCVKGAYDCTEYLTNYVATTREFFCMYYAMIQ
jgi:hypothetical protein